MLRFDETRTMSENQVLFSTSIDSTGYFNFKGNLLSEEDKLYRIHANKNDNSKGFEFADTPNNKNFQNFIFTNKDTILFEKSANLWFSKSWNTNKVDKTFKTFQKESVKLIRQFIDIKNQEVRNQSVITTLNKLKQYANDFNVSPLPTLLILNNFPENILRKDYENKSNFYISLYDDFLTQYGESSYTLQYKGLLSRLSISPNEKRLTLHKNLNYLAVVIIILLIIIVMILTSKLKKQKRLKHDSEINSLTKQENRVTELLLQNKSNKEIASELFVSLSTIKTHVRNIFAKFDVNSREEFKEKMKNQPKD